jgi:hypothetical protein
MSETEGAGFDKNIGYKERKESQRSMKNIYQSIIC